MRKFKRVWAECGDIECMRHKGLPPSSIFGEEFIPEDQWHKKRMDVLKKYATQLSE